MSDEWSLGFRRGVAMRQQKSFSPLASRPSPLVRRHGKILALFALLAPILAGMAGLVVDGGLLMAARRQAQNAADAAATGAALDKFKGASDSTALATAQSLVTNNGVAVTLTLNGGASNALNIPPQDPAGTGSPFTGQGNYVEAIVTQSVTTLFIQVLGINSSQQVT